MTLDIAPGGRDDEGLAEQVVTRLWGILAQMRISHAQLARAIDWKPNSLSRRMTGKKAFDLAEIDQICNALGIDRDELLTGQRGPRYPGGNEGLNAQLPRLDSNQQPFDYRVERELAEVIPLPQPRRHDERIPA